MSSPFSLFRRHQRVLMVVTTGLAMISFVLLGAVQDPRDMPTPLVVLFLAAMVGGLFWLAGLSRGKASDWGLTGVILGVVIGLVLAWNSRESAAVTIDGGNITQTELSDLVRQRQVANSFVQMAAMSSVPEKGDNAVIGQKQFEASQRIQNNSFSYLGNNASLTEDVIIGEVLRREAGEIGISISDTVVHDFMQEVSGNTLTQESFARIRRELGVSETSLVDMLRQEILSREAAKLIRSQTYLTPQNQWDFYQKLNVTQSAEMVAIPVSSFVTDAMTPTDEELQTLLNQYRENLPGFTPEGRPDEGRPGFFQLPKMKLAYLEAVYDDIKATVGEVTDEEIEKRFKEDFLDDVPAEAPAEMKTPEGTTPPTLPPKAEEPKAEEPKAEEPKAEEPKAEEPKAEEPKAEEPKAEDNSQSFNPPSLNGLQFVSFEDDKKEDQPAAKEEPAKEAAPETETPKPAEPAEKTPAPAPKEETPAPAEAEKKPETPAPAQDKPAAPLEAPAKPADGEKGDAEKSAEMKAPATGNVDVPPAPEDDSIELNDERKAMLREEILRDRTNEKIAVIMQQANQFVLGLANKYRLGDFEEDYVSLEEATQQIKDYAAKNNLEYIETPYLTLNELRSSEDYPIGSAFIFPLGGAGGFRTVLDELQQSIPTILFNVNQARRFNLSETGSTDSRYIFWKIGYQKEYSPKTIDDEPAVREQLTKVWKQQQADSVAKKRAEALAELVGKSDKPMSEALGDETVTGSPDSLFLTVRETGEFKMMTQGMAPSTNPLQPPQQGPPRYSVVPGAEDAGERFFNTVFEELEPGSAGVAPNRDGSIYYVVKIKDRNPSSPEQLEEMRKRFLEQGDQMAYYYMSMNMLSQYAGDWRSELLKKYNVQFTAQPAVDEAPEEG